MNRNGMLREKKQAAFQKTETLLYNYRSFQRAIRDKMQQIEDIKQAGVKKKSTSVTYFSKNPMYEVKSDHDRADEKIEAIENSIHVTVKFMRIIDNAMDSLRDDPYFDIIRMKYFEGRNREDIAEYFEVDASTVSRNKNRLINQLQIRLFSDEVLIQIFS